MKKYKLGELIEVTRGASLNGNYYAASGKYIRLTCGNFDYRNNCFKENTSKDNLYYTGEFRADFLLEKEAKKENNTLKNESCLSWKSSISEHSIRDHAKVV